MNESVFFTYHTLMHVEDASSTFEVGLWSLSEDGERLSCVFSVVKLEHKEIE